jgi:hypothetical protein
MSPAYPLSRSWPYILGALEALADVVIAFGVRVGLAVAVGAILTSDEKRSDLDQYIKDVDINVKKAAAKSTSASTDNAYEAMGSLSKIGEKLRDLQQGLEDNASSMGRLYLNRVNGLINAIDKLKSDLYQQVDKNNRSPGGVVSTPKPTVYSDTGSPVGTPYDRARRAGAESVTRSETNRKRDRRFNNNGEGLPPSARPTNAKIPPFNRPTQPQVRNPEWDNAPTADWPNVRNTANWPNVTTGYPETVVYGRPVKRDTTAVNRRRSSASSTAPRTSPRTAERSNCQGPDPLIEKIKELLEQGLQELSGDTTNKAAEEGAKELNNAFDARDKAKKRNPSLYAGKPDLRSTVTDALGQKVDKLSPELREKLENYYQFQNQNASNPRQPARWTIQVRRGQGNDKTVPKLQIDKLGRIMPSKANTNNRVSQSHKLPGEFAKVNGFDPPPKGLLANLKNPGRYSIEAISGAVQFHHKIPDEIWQSNALTKEMQKRINAGDKTVLGVDHGGNLTAMFKRPDAKEKYNSFLNDIRHKDTAAYRNISSRIEALQKKGVFLTDLFHNGSHDIWSKRANLELDRQLEVILKENPGKTLEQLEPKDLNKAYQRATVELGKELKRADEKARQRKPTGKDWGGDDKCTPEQGNRLAQTPREIINSVALARENLELSIKQLEERQELVAKAELKAEPKVELVVEPVKVTQAGRGGFEIG